MKKLIMLLLLSPSVVVANELRVEFIKNKIVVEKNGTVVEIEVDKEDLLAGDDDEIVLKALNKLKKEGLWK